LTIWEEELPVKRTLISVAAIALIAASALAPLSTAAQDPVALTIESWRNDDLTIWQDQIIPAFETANPGITVTFAPTPPTEYNAALQTKLEGGTAGDLITCRPFDASLALFEAGYLTSLNDLCPGWPTSVTSPRAPGSPMTARTCSACRWPR
jgi:ABC-type glycerol-3-phosphate transport system substrate-binding protein